MNQVKGTHAVVRTKSTRQHILDVARSVFATNGFGKTSLDQIGLEAGVSKMTIFYHFKNKEELVIASLEEAHAECMGGVLEDAAAIVDREGSAIRAIFSVLESRLARHELNDIYLRAVVEFGESDSDVTAAINRHFAEIEAKLESILIESGVKETGAVLPPLMLVLMGLYAKHLSPSSSLSSSSVTPLIDAILKPHEAFAA